MQRRDVLKYTAYLTGYAVSAPLVSAILGGCQAEPAGAALPYSPKFFSATEFATISEMAETMLPATDTPGAKEVGVPAFIDLMLADYTEAEDQERWRKGLRQLMDEVETQHGKPFTGLGAEERLAYLNALDAAAKAEAEAVDQAPLTADEKADRYPFFLLFKGAAIGGYFSSAPIGTEVLAYDPVPGQYAGCIPLSANGGVNWSL